MSPNAFAARLQGGDRRAIGQSNAVAEAVAAQPDRFDELWHCLTHMDAVVRMRAADALEKLGRTHPKQFEAHKTVLLSGALEDGTPELRWHLVAIAARLPLSKAEATSFGLHLNQLIRHDRSRIVRVMALQAFFTIAASYPPLAAAFEEALAYAADSGLPSLRARAAKLARARRTPLRA